MIIQCQGCAARYFLPQDKVPADPLKVRCPKCKSVFVLEPRNEPIEVSVSAGASRESNSMPAPPSIELAPPTPTPENVPASATTQEAHETVESHAPVEDAPTPKAAPRGGRSKEDRAKRLARVLVSDILWYNREKRDQALEEGTLMSALGEDIKKSWELYKDKVGPEVANSTNYFKEALNEILADGQEIF